MIDVQNGVVGDAYDRDAVVANIGALVDKARAADVGRVGPALRRQPPARQRGVGDRARAEPGRAEPLVQKRYPDSFEETDLESVLAARGVGRLVVAGAQTDECVRSTLHGALVRGYDATLVGDAHTTEDLSRVGRAAAGLVIAHTNLYWGNHEAPGRTAGTVEAKDLDFAASGDA